MEQRSLSVLVLSVFCMFIFGTLVLPQVAATFFNTNSQSAGVFAAVTTPVFTVQPTPSSQTLPAGSEGAVQVEVAGTAPFTYQWFRNGVSIGNNYPIVYFASITSGDAGTYYVIVSNSAGQVTSNTATITVTASSATGPTITEQLFGSSSSFTGSPVTFNDGEYLYMRVTATGSGNTYTWYRSGTLVTSGVLGSELWIPSATAADAGYYKVVISNAYGSVTSNTVQAKINSASLPPNTFTITSPTNGKNVTGRIRVTGEAGSTWVNIAGYDSATKKVCADITLSVGTFTAYCDTTLLPNGTQTITLSAFSVPAGQLGGTMASASLTVNVYNVPPTTFTVTSPVSGTAVSGTFQVSGQTGSTWVNVVGFNSAMSKVCTDVTPNNGTFTLSCDSTKLSNGSQTMTLYAYSVPAGQTGGTMANVPLTVSVNNAVTPIPTPTPALTPATAPSISTQPVGSSVTVGATVSLSVSAQGTAPLSYQWMKGGINISGQTSSALTITNAQTSGAGSYAVRVTNSSGSVTSNTISVSVSTLAAAPPPNPNAPGFAAQPIASTANTTGTAIVYNPGVDYLYVYMTVSGIGPFTYRWYHNGVLDVLQTADTLWFNPASTAQEGTWFAVVSNASGSGTSLPVTVSTQAFALTAPSITTQSSSRSVTSGSVLSLSVSVSGTAPITYQWSKNGTSISSQTNPTLTIANAQSSDAGTYTLRAANSVGSVTSQSIAISVSAGGTSGVSNAQIGYCGSCDHLDGVPIFENIIGRPADYVHAWGWGDTAGNMVYSGQYIDEYWSPSRFYLHWRMPMIISGTTFQDTINGTYDYAYTAWANRIKARDPQALVVMGTEMNGTWYDWSQDGPAGSAAKFAEAYRHIVTVMRQSAPNLQFVFNPGNGKWGGIDWLQTYPGDAYVDYISYDIYEDGPWLPSDPAARWATLKYGDGRGLDFLAQFAKDHNKKIAFDEWGTNVDDGYFITRMYEYFIANNVSYHMYWDSNAAFSGKLVNQPTNLAVFKALFGKR